MSGDVDALTVILRRGAHNVRSEDESRHEAMARAVLGSAWLRAHDDRIRAEALAPVLALADEWQAEGDEMSHWFAAQVLYNLIDQARAAAGTPTHHTTEEDADE